MTAHRLRLLLAWTLMATGAACSSDGDGGPPGTSDGATERSWDECGNGSDDDGDGAIDEGCSCAAGEEQPCFRGALGLRGVGLCADGVQRCDATAEFGYWGSCDFDRGPTGEVCDGDDDEDCDGAVDEGCPCTEGATRGCGGDVSVGACRPGEQRCTAGEWASCSGAVVPTAEVCGDGIDNDCDGSESEGCGCTPEPEVCGDGIDNDCDGQEDEGCACTPRPEACDDGTDDDCDGAIDEGCMCDPAPEECGNVVDDDCDGAIDEGCEPTCSPIADGTFREHLEVDWPLEDVTIDHDGRVTVVRGVHVSPIVTHFSPDGRLLWEATLDAPPSYPRSGMLPGQKHDLQVDEAGDLYLAHYVSSHVYEGTSYEEGTVLWKLSRSDGARVWDRWLPRRYSPVLEVGSALCVLGSATTGLSLAAYDRTTGADVWSREHPQQGIANLQLASDGAALFVAARVQSRPANPVDLGGSPFTTPSGFPEFALASYDLATGAFQWVWHDGTTERDQGLQALSVGGGHVDLAVGVAGEMTFAGTPVVGRKAGEPTSRLHVFRFDQAGNPRAVVRVSQEAATFVVGGMATRPDGGVYLRGLLVRGYLENLAADLGGPVLTYPDPAERAHVFLELAPDLSFRRQVVYPGHGDAVPGYDALAYDPCADAIAHVGAGTRFRHSGFLDFGTGYESRRGSFVERLPR